jgi:glycosyltransferase involved in cell wall biosynthesis
MPGRLMARHVLRHAALVHTVSDALSAEVRRIQPRVSQVLTLTQGIDVGRFACRSQRPQGAPIRLLCTRSLFEVYDPSTIVRACSRLLRDGVAVTLTMAGGGPMLSELRSQAEALDIQQSITFLGGYHQAQLPELLSSHDVYVSASVADGTSVSLLEAMAGGLFPVVSRIPANTAWLEDQQTALMFEPGSEQELAAAIAKLAETSDLMSQAVAENRRVVEARGNRSSNMKLLEDYYYRILGA